MWIVFLSTVQFVDFLCVLFLQLLLLINYQTVSAMSVVGGTKLNTKCCRMHISQILVALLWDRNAIVVCEFSRKLAAVESVRWLLVKSRTIHIIINTSHNHILILFYDPHKTSNPQKSPNIYAEHMVGLKRPLRFASVRSSFLKKPILQWPLSFIVIQWLWGHNLWFCRQWNGLEWSLRINHQWNCGYVGSQPAKAHQHDRNTNTGYSKKHKGGCFSPFKVQFFLKVWNSRHWSHLTLLNK